MAKKQTFEAGMSELEALTARLETGDMTLDETMKTYEKGVTLAAQLKRQLEDSRKRIGQIDPETAEITVNGEALPWRQYTWVMLNKPAGYLSATEDGRGATVLDLLPQELQRQHLFPVGRLDKDTEGLMLLTDDGELAHRLLSPKYHVDKRYYARVDGPLGPADAAAFAAGLTLEDGLVCLPAGLEPLGPGECIVTLREGKFHQVKRMLAARGAPVLYLKRLSMGPLALDGTLAPGAFRELTAEETAALRAAARL